MTLKECSAALWKLEDIASLLYQQIELINVTILFTALFFCYAEGPKISANTGTLVFFQRYCVDV